MPFPVDQSFLAEKLYRRPSFVIAKRAVLVDRGADATLESKKKNKMSKTCSPQVVQLR